MGTIQIDATIGHVSVWFASDLDDLSKDLILETEDDQEGWSKVSHMLSVCLGDK